jgi:hypothetical protein
MNTWTASFHRYRMVIGLVCVLAVLAITDTASARCADVNGDGIVSAVDYSQTLPHLGEDPSDPLHEKYDIDEDGDIDEDDLAAIEALLGTVCDGDKGYECCPGVCCVPPANPIPTLSEWGLAAMGGMILVAAAVLLRTRKTVAT